MNFLKSIILIPGLFCTQAMAATISWDVTNYSADPGEIFTLDIIGTGFSGNVDGGGIDLSFDASVVNILSVSIDEAVWDFGNSAGNLDNVGGTLDGLMVNTFNDVTGDYVVASVEFQAVGPGISTLTLSEFDLNPWASGGSMVNPDFVSASVGVVPLPPAIWLFGAGIITLAGMRRRRS